MHPRYDDACDAMDASVFTGELVSNAENRKGFKEYLERWMREVEVWDRLEADEAAKNA